MRYFIDYIFIGGGVMKNKQVKQMIAQCAFNKTFGKRQGCRLIKFIVSDFIFLEVNDPLVFRDYRLHSTIQMTQGVISLTASQLNNRR